MAQELESSIRSADGQVNNICAWLIKKLHIHTALAIYMLVCSYMVLHKHTHALHKYMCVWLAIIMCQRREASINPAAWTLKPQSSVRAICNCTLLLYVDLIQMASTHSWIERDQQTIIVIMIIVLLQLNWAEPFVLVRCLSPLHLTAPYTTHSPSSKLLFRYIFCIFLRK